MALARELAQRIGAMHYDALPAAAVHWCKVALLDTTGVILAGSREPAPLMVEDVLGAAAHGRSLIFGSQRRTSCLDAALINGTAAHVLDFDNATNTMFGHASATMMPALIAAGEEFAASGRDLLLAHAVGFETGARIGRAVNMHHYKKGWHPTSTLGVFAVAAACAKLLKLSVEQTQAALALSTSLASGIKANFGTMTKALHAGQCARGGLFAALLARKGFTANPDAFEHEHGFFNVFDGAGNYDSARVLEGWGKPLDVVNPGACYKQYPSCASTHPAIDAALEIVRAHGPFAAESIERVDVWTAGVRLAHTNRAAPETALDAKFSVQYCVARALIQGEIVLEDFEADAHRDPRVGELLPKVHAAPYSDQQFAAGNLFGGEVKLTLANGRVFVAKLDRPLGRTAANPIAMEQIKGKFENCAGRILDPAAIAALVSAVDTFEDLPRITDFTELLTTPASATIAQKKSVLA